MNWDDLRIVVAVRDEGTYAGAGARLRIVQTTVARRLARLERDLGIRLFDAVDGMRKPTAQCEALLGHVQAMAGHAAEIGKIGEDLPRVGGRFRIACTRGIGEEILGPRLDRFLAENPGLALQLITASENVKFSRWEADLAIRLRKPDKGAFTITRLADLRLYFIEPAAGAGGDAVVCNYPDDLGPIPESRFLKSRGLQERARFTTDNVRIMRELLARHRAVGVLPDYLCADLLADPKLRLTALAQRRDVWLLVQNHLKRDRAVRQVIAWLRDCFQELRRT